VNVNAGFAISNAPKGDAGPYARLTTLRFSTTKYRILPGRAFIWKQPFGVNHSGNYILHNCFTNMWEGIQTYALLADISNNTMSQVGRGLSRHGVNVPADVGFVPQITNNTITMGDESVWQTGRTRVIGIWINYHRDTADPLIVSGNTVNFPNAYQEGHTAYGFWALTIDGGRTVTFSDNTVNGGNNCTIGFLGSAITGGATVTVQNGELNDALYGRCWGISMRAIRIRAWSGAQR